MKLNWKMILGVGGGLFALWWLMRRAQAQAPIKILEPLEVPTPDQLSPPPAAVIGMSYEFNLAARQDIGLPDSSTNEWEVTDIAEDETGTKSATLYSDELDMQVVLSLSRLTKHINQGNATETTMALGDIGL